MTDPLARNWWALALRGGAALGFGLVALLHPALTVSALVAAFAAFAFADGVLAIIAALRPPGNERRALARRDALLLEGTLGLALGLGAALWPDITAFALLACVATWAIATGACALVAAWRLRERVPGAWLLGAIGLATITFGAFLAIAPVAGVLAVVGWIGGYALAVGALRVALALWLRGHVRTRLATWEAAGA